LRYTTNAITVEGNVAFFLPQTNVPLIADMSNDIFNREIPFQNIR